VNGDEFQTASIVMYELWEKTTEGPYLVSVSSCYTAPEPGDFVVERLWAPAEIRAVKEKKK